MWFPSSPWQLASPIPFHCVKLYLLLLNSTASPLYQRKHWGFFFFAALNKLISFHCVSSFVEVKASPTPMFSVEMDHKQNGPVDVKSSVENGRPPDLADWAVADVHSYFRAAGFEEQARAFQEQIPRHHSFFPKS
ncbi:sterile alpha motif domain-containing protein 13 isoform X2 [Pleurodeles waltl]|uniref:sterile alpha motif domain-containing protein 13 isoform X2 n=1 Tax=Pleurodeles waltl TaxID=8319 RepID=UPI003709C08B